MLHGDYRVRFQIEREREKGKERGEREERELISSRMLHGDYCVRVHHRMEAEFFPTVNEVSVYTAFHDNAEILFKRT